MFILWTYAWTPNVHKHHFSGFIGQHGIPRESVNNIRTAMDLLVCMEQYKYLGPQNTWLLQNLLYRVGSKPLYRKVYEYATKRFKDWNTLHVYEPSEIQGTSFKYDVLPQNREHWGTHCVKWFVFCTIGLSTLSV